MKRLAFSLLFAAVAASTILAASPTQRYELKVNDFEELSIVDGINVVYRCSPDSAGIVSFTSTSDVASVIMFTPKKNKLKIQLNTDGEPITGLPEITLYSSLLKKVENSGDSIVRVVDPFCPDKFSARVIGNGTITAHGLHAQEVNLSVVTGKGQLVASGSCDKLSCSLTGTGTIQADALRCANASCKIVGTGTIGCWPFSRLAIYGIGSGKVYYRETPTQLDNRSLGIKAFSM